MGIRATHNLAEEGNKGRHGGKRKSCKEKKRRETKLLSLRKNWEK
jgi:hypothetical protein